MVPILQVPQDVHLGSESLQGPCSGTPCCPSAGTIQRLFTNLLGQAARLTVRHDAQLAGSSKDSGTQGSPETDGTLVSLPWLYRLLSCPVTVWRLGDGPGTHLGLLQGRVALESAAAWLGAHSVPLVPAAAGLGTGRESWGARAGLSRHGGDRHQVTGGKVSESNGLCLCLADPQPCLHPGQ